MNLIVWLIVGGLVVAIFSTYRLGRPSALSAWILHACNRHTPC